MTHTKGPWAFEELAAKDGDGYVLTTEGNRVEIAHHGGAYSMGLPRAEVLANARLIAAAPETAAERDRLREVNAELLDALDNLLTYDRVERPAFRAKPEGAPHSSVRILQDKLIWLEDQARAAIAKAKATP